MSRYASRTTVPVERSEAEIKATLQRYGARRFMSGTDEDAGLSVIQFEMHDRRVMFRLQVPPVDAFATDRAGRQRSATAARNAWEQEQRRLWRALLITIKAKLESVESGIETFEEAFLPQIVLPGPGMRTYGDVAVPQIAEVYATGHLPALMDGYGA